MIPKDKIRPAIKEMESKKDLFNLVKMCFDAGTEKEDKEFIQECLSEIHWREKHENKKRND